MNSLALARKVDLLLSDLEQVDPISFNLGTPELPEVDAMHQLVNMGPVVVPCLLKRLLGEPSKKRIAYIVLVLKNIGDIRALESLFDLQTRFQKREIKDEWDYAVIGQCTLAIKHLQEAAGPT
jgi:hypothetical protein